jgi:hypothetical protein
MIVIIEASGSTRTMHIIEPETEETEPGYGSYHFTAGQWVRFKTLIDKIQPTLIRGSEHACID